MAMFERLKSPLHARRCGSGWPIVREGDAQVCPSGTFKFLHGIHTYKPPHPRSFPLYNNSRGGPPFFNNNGAFVKHSPEKLSDALRLQTCPPRAVYMCACACVVLYKKLETLGPPTAAATTTDTTGDRHPGECQPCERSTPGNSRHVRCTGHAAWLCRTCMIGGDTARRRRGAGRGWCRG